MKRFLSGIVLASVLAFSGCSTHLQAWSMDEGPAILGGVRMVGATFTADHTTVGDIILACLDFPLSLAMDCAILPFSAINEVVAGGIDVNYPAEVKPRGVRYHGERRRSTYEQNRYDAAAEIAGIATEDEAAEATLEEEGEATETVEGGGGEELGESADPPPEEPLDEGLDGLDEDLEDMDSDLGDEGSDLGDEGADDPPMEDDLEGEDPIEDPMEDDLEDEGADDPPMEDEGADDPPMEDDLEDEDPMEDDLEDEGADDPPMEDDLEDEDADEDPMEDDDAVEPDEDLEDDEIDIEEPGDDE